MGDNFWRLFCILILSKRRRQAGVYHGEQAEKKNAGSQGWIGGRKNKEEARDDETEPIIWMDDRADKRRAGGYGRRGTGDGRG